jgi:spore maturation protein CgeB
VLDESHFFPTEWTTLPAKIIRRLFRSVMVGELAARARALMKVMKPEALFVFKGNYVSSRLLADAQASGVITMNYYPDVSFLAHGPQLPGALPLYDHIFNTKSFGLADMRSRLGIRSVSFLPPGFDPDVHRPIALGEHDRSRFECDASFIGTWSPKKESILVALASAMPGVRLRIWGNQWEKRASRALDDAVMGDGVTGDNYAKAICGSRICLGLLSEARLGASSGDLITARTFQIPACRTFMLHERNAEVAAYFEEGAEAEFFSSDEELQHKVQYYLDRPAERTKLAASGYDRSLRDDYSIDSRMRVVTGWLNAALERSAADTVGA